MKKILVVCYSQSGNTHQAACEIQKQTGGDICEIYPWQPYPMEYERLLEQAKKEIRTGYMPHLLPITHDPNDYDIIFTGTPNWCDTLAPPLTAFLRKYKLSEKRIIPFCTHGGGGSGHIFEDIAKICVGCEIMNGISLPGSDPNMAESVARSLKQIGLK